MTTRLKRAPKSLPISRGFPMGPWVGMRDALDPSANERGLARQLRNVYPSDPQFGGSVRPRPVFSTINAVFSSPIQAFHQFTKLDGARHTYVVVGGEVYEFNWSASLTWAKVLATATIGSRSTIGPWYAVTFNDKVIWSDGHTAPFSHDGTVNGGYAALSNAPAFYGPIWVHYGKLMGIDASDRATIMWSEENQPGTGYDQGGYNNAWTLLQTDTDPLYRGLPTNDGLIVFRRRSTTAITGEVNENFASTGTREAVSSEVGCGSPDSVFFGGEDGELIFFTDADGRPHVMKPGGSPQPIWEDARNEIRRFDPGHFNKVQGYWDPLSQHAVFCFMVHGETTYSVQLRYQVKGGVQLACIWDGYNADRFGVLENLQGSPRVMHGEVYYASASVYVVFTHDLPGRTPSTVSADYALDAEDSYVTAPDTESVLSAAGQGSAQAFTASLGAGYFVRQASLKLFRSASAVTGYVRAKIYALTGTYGTSAVPVGVALTTSDSVDISTFDVGTLGTVVFTFRNPIRRALVDNATYAIAVEVVEISGGSVSVGYVAAGAHGGNRSSLATSGTWTASAGSDLWFQVASVRGLVPYRVESQPAPDTPDGEWVFDLLDVRTPSDVTMPYLYARTRTPYNISEPALVGFQEPISEYDLAEWDEDVYGDHGLYQHGVLGIDAMGPGCGVIIDMWDVTSGTLPRDFGLHSLVVTGRVVGRDVRRR